MEKFEFFSDEHVNKLQTYIEEHFNAANCANHLVHNILNFVASQGEDNETTLLMLEVLLDDIGITREEIIKAVAQ